ncbi:hypothetical protein [Streptomyces sp. 769]|uniref:hypothetical protein n=1 Tax=Streptomyces sp. 769 TaxID=1262452 RepID=UPI0005822B80|nr:hypothetical protein [Streptomyces sp. 769]AJC58544.1 hypothetical protein GZL_05971 [Streptomyces sp. 769]
MNVVGLIFGACAILIVLSSATYLAVSSRPAREEAFYIARYARIAAFTGCFISAAAAIPAIATATDAFLHRNGIATLSSNLGADIAALGLMVMSVNWTHQDADLRKAVMGRVFLFGCIMTVVTAEFHFTDVPSTQLASTSPIDGASAAYMLTHLCPLIAITTTLGLRYAKLAAAVWQQRRAAAVGLAATATGIFMGWAYDTSRAGAVVAYLLGHPWPAVEAYVVPVTGALCTLFVALGLTLPTIGHRVILPLRQEAAQAERFRLTSHP